MFFNFGAIVLYVFTINTFSLIKADIPKNPVSDRVAFHITNNRIILLDVAIDEPGEPAKVRENVSSTDEKEYEDDVEDWDEDDVNNFQEQSDVDGIENRRKSVNEGQSSGYPDDSAYFDLVNLQHVLECDEETGFSIKDMFNKEKPETGYCLRKCILTKDGSLETNGVINVDNIKKFLNLESGGDDHPEGFYNCLSKVGPIIYCDEMRVIEHCYARSSKII